AARQPSRRSFPRDRRVRAPQAVPAPRPRWATRAAAVCHPPWRGKRTETRATKPVCGGSGARRSRHLGAAAFLLRRRELLLHLRRAGASVAVEVLVRREAAQAALHVAARFVEGNLLDEDVER